MIKIPEYIFEKLNESEKQDMIFTIISASVAGTNLKECDVKRKIPNYFFEKLNEDEINDIISILKNAYQEGVKVRKRKIDYYIQKDVNCCIEFHDLYEED